MKKVLLLCLMLLPITIMAEDLNKLEVCSPNENVVLHFWVDKDGRPTYEMN